MIDQEPASRGGGGSLIERRVRRIVNARSVTVGLALTFVGLALVGGLLMWIADPHNFPSVGLGVWWALQTVTTVGYGDVVPTSTAGRVIITALTQTQTTLAQLAERLDDLDTRLR
jgi:hypothetical protein